MTILSIGGIDLNDEVSNVMVKTCDGENVEIDTCQQNCLAPLAGKSFHIIGSTTRIWTQNRKLKWFAMGFLFGRCQKKINQYFLMLYFVYICSKGAVCKWQVLDWQEYC